MSQDLTPTVTKRLYTEVDPDSSPEAEPKRSMTDMSAIVKAIEAIQHELKGLSGLKELVQQTNDTVGSNTTTLSDIKASLDSLGNRVNICEHRINNLESRIVNDNINLRRRVNQLEERAVRQEAYNRRDNLILDGLQWSEGENPELKVREVIRITLKCPDSEIKFTRVHRLGTTGKIIMRFHFYQDREMVWSKRRLLKGSGLWLEEDFPSEWRNRRQVLYPIMKLARQIPETKAFLVQDKLIVNSESYTVGSIAKLPEAISLANILEVKDDNVFFGAKSSPLSNFYPASITRDGTQYNCVEQVYQETKALVNGDHTAAEDIRMMSDPVQMYRRAQKIKIDSNKWTDGKRLKVMEEALLLKYQQNKHLRDVLLSTDGLNIWEARSSDTFFGSGMSVSAMKQCTDLGQVEGHNHLGKLLVKVREELKNSEEW